MFAQLMEWTLVATNMICSDGFVKCLACRNTSKPARVVAMTVKTAATMIASV